MQSRPTIDKNDLAIKKFKSLFGLDEFYRNQLVISLDESKVQPQYQNQQHDQSNNIIHMFNLEALHHCKKHTWNAAIKKAITLDPSSQEITDIDFNKINTQLFSKFLYQLRTALFGPLHFTGQSFSDKQIVMGDLYSYYIQYLAETFFGHPQVIEPFQNTIEIRQNISEQLEEIFIEFTNVLKKTDTNSTNQHNIFSRIPYITDKGFILSIPIKISPPIIDGFDFIEKNKMIQTYWTIHILFL